MSRVGIDGWKEEGRKEGKKKGGEKEIRGRRAEQEETIGRTILSKMRSYALLTHHHEKVISLLGHVTGIN